MHNDRSVTDDLLCDSKGQGQMAEMAISGSPIKGEGPIFLCDPGEP